MSKLPNYADVQIQLQACQSKEETFKALVGLSKSLPRLAEAEKVEEHQVKGCESKVWLLLKDEAGVVSFNADSDAKLMRGVLVAILSLANETPLNTLNQIDFNTHLNNLNLGSYLTPSRSNGVLGIIDKILSISQSN